MALLSHIYGLYPQKRSIDPLIKMDHEDNCSPSSHPIRNLRSWFQENPLPPCVSTLESPLSNMGVRPQRRHVVRSWDLSTPMSVGPEDREFVWKVIVVVISEAVRICKLIPRITCSLACLLFNHVVDYCFGSPSFGGFTTETSVSISHSLVYYYEIISQCPQLAVSRLMVDN